MNSSYFKMTMLSPLQPSSSSAHKSPLRTPSQTAIAAQDAFAPSPRLAFGNATARTSQQCSISRISEVESRSFASCSAARQAFHVSEAGPASTSNRDAMNGSSANGNGYIKLAARQKPRTTPANETVRLLITPPDNVAAQVNRVNRFGVTLF